MLERRVYIVSKTTKLTEEVKLVARNANCSEIAIGIPPALAKTFLEKDLPVVFSEFNNPPSESRNLADELDELKLKVSNVETDLEFVKGEVAALKEAK